MSFGCWIEDECPGEPGALAHAAGYLSRQLVLDDEVRHMINKRSSTLNLRQRARELGMRTLREDGIRKVLGGLTSAS